MNVNCPLRSGSVRAIDQRDANGNIVRNAAGPPVVAAPLASLAGTQLAYVERAAKASRSYGDLYGQASMRHFISGRI
jgi:hypothetical protein